MHFRRAQRFFKLFALSFSSFAVNTVYAQYSSTPTVVYNVATDSGNFPNGAGTLSLAGGSSSFPASLVNQSNNFITGLGQVSSTGLQSLLYFNIATGSLNLVHNSSDPNSLQSGSTPTFKMLSSSGTLVGLEQVQQPGSSGPTGVDVFYTPSGTSASTITVPAPTSVLGGSSTASYQTVTIDGYFQQSFGAGEPGSGSTSLLSAPIESDGVIVGSISRYQSSSTYYALTLGADGFYYTPGSGGTQGTSVAMGLSGTGYDYGSASFASSSSKYHNTSVTGVGNGVAAGYTVRYAAGTASSTGSDAWIYSPTVAPSTTQIGLAGGSYSYTGTVSGVTGTFEYSLTTRVNAKGQIAGRSLYMPTGPNNTNGQGFDAWLYTPSTTPGTASTFGTSSAGSYVQLGLAVTPTSSALGNINQVATASAGGAANVVGYRYTYVNLLGDNGHSVGLTTRFDNQGNAEGLAAWYYNGIGNTEISPNVLEPTNAVNPMSDTIHPATAGQRYASTNLMTALNNNGMAAGYATRVASTASNATLGQDAYVYDNTTGKEYYVDPTDESTSGYELSYVSAISSSGVAIGYFNTYSGTSSTVLSSTLFAWTELGGLDDLATFSGSTYASSMSAYASEFVFGSDGNLYGPNSPSAASEIIEYSAVPEPNSGMLLGLCVLPFLARRRRKLL